MSWKTKLISVAIGLGLAFSMGLSATPAQARVFVGFGDRPFYRPYPVFYRPYLLPPPPPPVLVARRPIVLPPPPPVYRERVIYREPVVYREPIVYREYVPYRPRPHKKAVRHRICNCNKA